jgi:hypothetical protein
MSFSQLPTFVAENSIASLSSDNNIVYGLLDNNLVMSFDGNYHQVYNSNPIVSDKATIYGWLKVAHDSMERVIYAQGTAETGVRITPMYIAVTNDNRLQITVSNNLSYMRYTTSGTIPNNTWFSFSITFDISASGGSSNINNFTVYINNAIQTIVASGSDQFSTIYPSYTVGYIGAAVVDSSYVGKFKGLMSNLRLYNTVLSITDISNALGALPPTYSNLIVANGNRETFTQVGSDLTDSKWISGATRINSPFGYGVSLDGSAGHVEAISSDLTTYTTQGSISLWFKENSRPVATKYIYIHKELEILIIWKLGLVLL